jgi:formylglycine-generating enzyme required for sulfatase activity
MKRFLAAMAVLLGGAGPAVAAEPSATAELARHLRLVDPAALGRALDDLATTFPDRYPAAEFRRRLAGLESDPAALRARLLAGDAAAVAPARAWLRLQREALLANPLLDFRELLLVRRGAARLGLPTNWASNCSLPKDGYDNEIARLDLHDPAARPRPVFRPADGTFVGDLELHWDGRRLLFSKSAPAQPWQVYEVSLDAAGAAPRQVTPDLGPDVDNYDACYLPRGDVIFMSTAAMVAVPCVHGNTAVANLYRLGTDGAVRQLCFDQEHDWGPVVMEDGRLLYLRWEYADIPHAHSRRLFQMNPDGTGQAVFYGTNSYWPNSVFYARPIPGRPSQVAGIVTGHHGLARMGELVIFDNALGQSEAGGAVQRIPGFGKKVERLVKDALADDSWPRFLHPWPLGRPDGTGSGRYFLVSCQPAPDAPWGVYLADVFDNLLLLHEQRGQAMLEPMPLATRPEPPQPVDRVQPASREASVFIADVYAGPGLKGIPRGTVKALRLFSYVYSYRNMGGTYGTIGMNGPWDIRRILGTVPVAEDGSAHFRIPASTPISLQPLDGEGKALQLMRSWLVGMPGEVVSCNGCHEDRRTTPTGRLSLAATSRPVDITPWHGPARGFSFAREVQPVLDAACVSCHNGATKHQGRLTLNLRGDVPLEGWRSALPGSQRPGVGGRFSLAYANLFPFLHTPGIESNIGLLAPMEFHADTSELVQLLRKGHHGVQLDAAQWDRLITWIDLNAPFHGDWGTIAGEEARRCEERRAELRRRLAGVDEFHLEPPVVPAAPDPGRFVAAVPPRPAARRPAEAPRSGERDRPLQRITLGGGVELTFAYVPAGSFPMGGEQEEEQPVHTVRIPRGFWMAVTETTNAQYARFDPEHDTGREHLRGYAFGVEGYPLNQPGQPVARVSWHRAREFCAWLAARTGLRVELPTEAQWEYACRAGTVTPFSFGAAAADFSLDANLSDLTTREFAANNYLRTAQVPLPNPPPANDYTLKDERFRDNLLVSGAVGRLRPNRWGLHDLHGNVAEWTRSLHRPYPYVEDDGRNGADDGGRRVVRGGSWRDRPFRAAAGFRHAYQPHQRAVDVGFRVIVDEDRPEFPALPSTAVAAGSRPGTGD